MPEQLQTQQPQQPLQTLQIVPITQAYACLPAVETLYFTAFPQKERDPFRHLMDTSIDGALFVAFEENGVFCGFAYLLTYKDIAHLLYFAISPEKRAHGLGAAALLTLHDNLPGKRILADVEAEDESAVNLTERVRRIAFYKHNGYTDTDLTYTWDTVHYEILVFGGTVTAAEFDDFWHHFRRAEDMGEYLFQLFHHAKNSRRGVSHHP